MSVPLTRAITGSDALAASLAEELSFEQPAPSDTISSSVAMVAKPTARRCGANFKNEFWETMA